MREMGDGPRSFIVGPAGPAPGKGGGLGTQEGAAGDRMTPSGFPLGDISENADWPRCRGVDLNPRGPMGAAPARFALRARGDGRRSVQQGLLNRRAERKRPLDMGSSGVVGWARQDGEGRDGRTSVAGRPGSDAWRRIITGRSAFTKTTSGMPMEAEDGGAGVAGGEVEVGARPPCRPRRRATSGALAFEKALRPVFGVAEGPTAGPRGRSKSLRLAGPKKL